MNESAARYLHPSNLLTYMSVLAGLGAMFAAQQLRSWPVAGGLIAVCALADTFDGKFARLFARNDSLKEFGIQLDSLADALTFGVVPVVCLSLLLSFSSTAEWAAWCAAAFFYVVCAITRLGAYNLGHGESDGFIGVPTTVAGLIWSSVFLAQPSSAVSTAMLAACGIAMVSPLPVPRPRGIGIVAFVMWPVALITLHGARAGVG